jgi:SPX domain protein involved in polyphosphate accumulation
MKNKIKRFERKWIFKSNNFLALINALLRSNLFFRYQFPSRNVNSIYFDTSNYTSIRQNLDGVSNKKKIRIRWYGKSDIITNPVVEIKSKKGFETKKVSFQIKELENIKINNLVKIKEQLNTKLKSKKIINPVLSTHYKREYFISLNGKIRATIDYNLKSIFLNNFSQIDIIKNFKNICILELKYSTSLDKYVRDNLKDITLRLSKNSKFVNSALERPKFYS